MAARYKLMPCRLRDDQLVPLKGAEEIELDWRELTARLAPSNSLKAVKALKYLQVGAFIGLIDQGPNLPPSNFVYVAQDRSGNFAGVLKKSPGLANKISSVYQVKWISGLPELEEAKVGRK